MEFKNQSSFDELVKLTSLVLNCPIAAVTRLDRDHQKLVAQVGLCVNELPHDSKIFAEILSHNEICISQSNFENEPVFLNHSKILNREPCFYAGKKIVSKSGEVLGGLFVVGQSRDLFAESQFKILKHLAEIALELLELNLKGIRAELLIEDQKQRLKYSEKLASLGFVYGSIIHEINNPIAVIHSLAKQIRNSSNQGKVDLLDLVKKSEVILNTAQRIVHIVKGLKTFANGNKESFQLTGVKDLIENTLEYFQNNFKNNSTKLNVSSVSPELQIKCSPIQMSQVLINLLKNAIDAVQNTGERWILVDAVDDHQNIYISITDSGNGIPEEIREKIMSAFFTTKNIENGTGLGLTISKQIVEKHNGSLYLDENSPHTKFVIRLPKSLLSESF